ncbi:hypothetical protein ACFWPK_28660 [Nocardia sp. NPDC058519]|uniref:hypothetical protein n=1 Tax=Nocardia sp. NPDC058519 TaxID=3346535 RepID=UPI0036511F83
MRSILMVEGPLAWPTLVRKASTTEVETSNSRRRQCGVEHLGDLGDLGDLGVADKRAVGSAQRDEVVGIVPNANSPDTATSRRFTVAARVSVQPVTRQIHHVRARPSW